MELEEVLELAKDGLKQLGPNRTDLAVDFLDKVSLLVSDTTKRGFVSILIDYYESSISSPI